MSAPVTARALQRETTRSSTLKRRTTCQRCASRFFHHNRRPQTLNQSHVPRTAQSSPKNLPPPVHHRSFTTTATPNHPQSESTFADSDDPSLHTPRWSRTPPSMRAPYRSRPPNPNMSEHFQVNSDPRRLNDALRRFYGAEEWDVFEQRDNGYRGRVNGVGEGDTEGGFLPEEVKWLAVTHKSFDHGRRGFNDRLGFLGKRILELQTSLTLLTNPHPRSTSNSHIDPARPSPPTHASLTNLESLSSPSPPPTPSPSHPHSSSHTPHSDILHPSALASLASDTYNLNGVIRWKPKQLGNLKGSGVESVSAGVVYALVGAVALCRGGEVAGRVARGRVLGPLGVGMGTGAEGGQ
ncbi:MAG: hypothetical protein M1831_001296 [Alyxoria varia]|nr:MAG: hypothetical protein M1831_001296 [Alyxoria varia]